MGKYTIQIPETSYKKLHKKLQKYEIKIGNMKIGNFLIANSVIDDTGNRIATRIKRIVLHISGDFDSKPEDLQSGFELKTELRYGFEEYLLLRKRLDQLVKEYDNGARISAREANDCIIVGDCVDLISSKIVLNEPV